MKTCWQYQVKLIQAELNPDCGPRSLSDYLVCTLDYHTAKEFIQQYEWVGNMGTSKHCYGIFFESHLGGVVCFGPCIAPVKYRRVFGYEYRDKIIQLTRGATNHWVPKWCASKLISLALSQLRLNTRYRIVLAYADPDAGEIGTIYQASNALYFGMTNPGGGKKYIIHGHIYDPRKVVAKFGSRARHHLERIDPCYRTVPIMPKHRYVFVLGGRKERSVILDRIAHLIQGYPKRPIKRLV